MKDIFVTFADKKIEAQFESLNSGKNKEKMLYKFINRAISDLKKNPLIGTKIKKKLWPRDYVRKYSVTNLWKYDLPNAWRLIYTIQSDDVMILNIILEWFNHKDYEKKFKY